MKNKCSKCGKLSESVKPSKMAHGKMTCGQCRIEEFQEWKAEFELNKKLMEEGHFITPYLINPYKAGVAQ